VRRQLLQRRKRVLDDHQRSHGLGRRVRVMRHQGHGPCRHHRACRSRANRLGHERVAVEAIAADRKEHVTGTKRPGVDGKSLHFATGARLTDPSAHRGGDRPERHQCTRE